MHNIIVRFALAVIQQYCILFALWLHILFVTAFVCIFVLLIMYVHCYSLIMFVSPLTLYLFAQERNTVNSRHIVGLMHNSY